TPTQELLLRAALLDGPEAEGAFEAWQARVDLAQIDAGSFRLLPLLYANLTRLGIRSPLSARLRGIHRQAWYRNQVLFRRGAETLRALEGAGIPTLLLKGIPLALLHYRDEAVRPMADADVLVPTQAVTGALAVLRRAGWHPGRTLALWPPKHCASCMFRDEAG